MKTVVNQHGEKVTTIGTVTFGGKLVELQVIEFVSCGKPCFSLKGLGGHADARKFATQVKRAKDIYGDASLSPVWFC